MFGFLTFKHAALSVGGAAALLLSTGTTFGFAQPAPTQQAVIDDAAAKLGLSGDQLAQALREARQELGVRAAVRLDRRHALTVAATTLGLPDLKSLRKELAGTTLTAVASKHGVQPATVAAAIKADLAAQVDAQLAAGKITAKRAASLKQKLDGRVDALMTREFKAK
jgi:hypothetical protein